MSTSDEASHDQVGPKKTRVLVLGETSSFGSFVAEHTHLRYDLRIVVAPSDPANARLRALAELAPASGTFSDVLVGASENVDVILYLPKAINAETVPEAYHVFEAARNCGCRRVVVLSSTGGQPKSEHGTDIGGLSQLFSETLARHMAEAYGVDSIAVRVDRGPKDKDHTLGLTVRDEYFLHILIRCIEATAVKFAILQCQHEEPAFEPSVAQVLETNPHALHLLLA